MTDIGREVYIPWQMIKGQLLYKNIYTIFGPFPYQLNALWLKLVGDSLSSFYLIGLINSFLVINLVYAISREFLSKGNSFLITLFVMQSSIFAYHIFNFNFPYAYASVYAVSALLASLLTLLKYQKSKDVKFAYLASFFAGISLLSKYDYVLYILYLVCVFCFICPLTWRQKIKATLVFISMPLISYGALLIQGVTFSDWYNNFLLVQKMATTKELSHFYFSLGVYFHFNIFLQTVLYALIFLAIFKVSSFCLFKVNNKHRFFKILFIIIFQIVYFLYFIKMSFWSFAFLSVINAMILVSSLSKIYKNKLLFTLVITAFLTSFKAFYFLNMTTYGSAIVIFTLISVVSATLVLCDNDEKRIVLNRNIKMILLAGIVALCLINATFIRMAKNPIITPKGTLYTTYPCYYTNSMLMKYLEQNDKKGKKMIILPETPFMNYVLNMDSDNQAYTTLPVEVAVFGEEKIIQRFKQIKPEFFVVSNRKTEEYGYDYICKNYAFGLCSMIYNDYNQDAVFEEGKLKMIVYKRKDLK
ncbi:MAG: glycosyltransferase family 39 protein [Candidatus Gastranaerophilales bacterium]|nr:glycosyltransferase family 39 protein [Candidatus Gastranaerophilales bacterium]